MMHLVMLLRKVSHLRVTWVGMVGARGGCKGVVDQGRARSEVE